MKKPQPSKKILKKADVAKVISYLSKRVKVKYKYFLLDIKKS